MSNPFEDHGRNVNIWYIKYHSTRMMEVFQKWEGSEEKSHVILHYTKKKLEGTS